MEISQFTIRIMVLFLPGIISCLVVASLTVWKEIKTFHFVVFAFVLGFFSYFTYALLLKLINLAPWITTNAHVRFLPALLNAENNIEFTEILWVSLVSVIDGLLLSFVINKKYFHRIAQKLNITNKFPELDVWDYLFNSSDNTQLGCCKGHKKRFSFRRLG